MSTTISIFGDEARERLLRGVDLIASAVKATLGPKGRTVLIRKAYAQPRIVNDGVTVARAVEPEDLLERTGAEVMRAAAIRTSDVVGDGTTTATVLAQAIVREGVKAVAAGMNPMDLRRGIDAGVAAAVAHVRSQAHAVVGHDDMVRVGTISANGDAEIGALVADAMVRVGPEGAVTIEEAKGRETELEVVEGMQIDRGYLSPYFVNDAERAACVLDQPYILIHERRISDLKALLPLLEKVVESGRALLVVAEDLDSDVLATLVLNALRGGLKIAAVKAPEFGDRRKAVLQDMAVVTGATAISDELGIKLEAATLDVLGQASRVLVERDATTIVGGAGSKPDVEARCAQLRRQIAETTSDYDREKLQQRLAKLVGGVAIIRAGGATELEASERKDRVDDAVHATRAAVEEGVVPGGGVALLYAAAALNGLTPANEDQKVGVEIVRRALSAPVREIASNAGVDGAVVTNTLREAGDPSRGYDAQTGAYVDMIEAGILDPVKVVRLALENAASVAGLLITTEVVLVETSAPQATSAPSGSLDF